jgi:hypothetical protein
MITIEIPDNFEKVKVRLVTPRVITYKDGRKANTNITTLIPESLALYEVPGVYLIKKEGIVFYVGQTDNLNKRMRVHKQLINHPEIIEIEFLEEKDSKLRKLYEILYKWYYLKKVDLEERKYFM